VVARQHAERCLTLSEEHGFRLWRGLSGAVRGICTAVLEHSDVIYQEILHELRGYEFGITAPFMLLCEALLLRGQLDAVSQMIEQVLSKCSLNNERFLEAEL
jgi:hypothetical protein